VDPTLDGAGRAMSRRRDTAAGDLVVDGHNALHRLRLVGPDREASRARLLSRVRAAAPRGATVFFDGHPGTGAFAGTEDRGISVRFSGDVEADHAIVELVRASSRPRRFVVVTDDLELARRVEQMGASSLRVAQFLADVAAPDADDKPHGGTFTAADFDLPDEVDLNRPPSDLDARGGRPRPQRVVRRRP